MKKLTFLILVSVLASCASVPPERTPVAYVRATKTDTVSSWFNYHGQCVRNIAASETLERLEYNAAEAKEVRIAIERDIIDWSVAGEIGLDQIDAYEERLETCKGEESLAYVTALVRLNGDAVVTTD
jgi:hypothetical protein